MKVRRGEREEKDEGEGEGEECEQVHTRRLRRDRSSASLLFICMSIHVYTQNDSSKHQPECSVKGSTLFLQNSMDRPVWLPGESGAVN